MMSWTNCCVTVHHFTYFVFVTLDTKGSKVAAPASCASDQRKEGADRGTTCRKKSQFKATWRGSLKLWATVRMTRWCWRCNRPSTVKRRGGRWHKDASLQRGGRTRLQGHPSIEVNGAQSSNGAQRIHLEAHPSVELNGAQSFCP